MQLFYGDDRTYDCQIAAAISAGKLTKVPARRRRHV